MAWISAVVLVIHTFFSWFLILKLGWGLTGAAITLNISWWLIVITQLLYIFITKSDGAWAGFSWLAFADLWGFVKLSLASAVMLWCVFLSSFLLGLLVLCQVILSFVCQLNFSLEFWYLMILVVITGRLQNPLIPVDAISIWYAASSSPFWIDYRIFQFHKLSSFVLSILLQYEHTRMGCDDCPWVQCCNKVIFPASSALCLLLT